MKKLLTSLIAGVGALAVALPAMAYNYWGAYVGNIWINQWTVESDYDGTTVWLNVSMPTCNSVSQLMGDVVVDYYAYDGGYLENYTVNAYGYEGYQGWISVSTWATMGEEGTVYVTDETYCGPLDYDPYWWQF